MCLPVSERVFTMSPVYTSSFVTPIKPLSTELKGSKDEKQSLSPVAVVRSAFCYASDVSLPGITSHWTEHKFVDHHGDQSLYEKRSMQN
jgi:hypothetical protein